MLPVLHQLGGGAEATALSLLLSALVPRFVWPDARSVFNSPRQTALSHIVQ
jgi:hypothetical protein